MASNSFSSSCKLPGCSRPQFSEYGVVHEFCGRTHAEMYRRQYGSYKGEWGIYSR